MVKKQQLNAELIAMRMCIGRWYSLHVAHVYNYMCIGILWYQYSLYADHDCV